MTEAQNQIETLSTTFTEDVVPSNENNEIIERCDDYVVSIRHDKRRLDLVPNNAVRKAIAEDSNLSREFRRAHTYHAQPILNLKVSDQLAYLRLLGNGFAAVFAKQADDAVLAIDEAKQYLNAKRDNTARVWFFQSSSVTFATLFFGAWIVLLTQGCGSSTDGKEKVESIASSESMEQQPGANALAAPKTGKTKIQSDQATNADSDPKPNSGDLAAAKPNGLKPPVVQVAGAAPKPLANPVDPNVSKANDLNRPATRGDYEAILNEVKNFPFVLCFMFGVMGAMVSVLSRLTVFPSDIMAGKAIHYIDGSSRILAGGIFAILGSLAFYANVFLGFLNPSDGRFGIVLCLVAVVSGVSERLIPSLVASFETRSATEQANLNEDPDPA
ncbi:hypothetical protein OAG71_03015 [bacterium]|nr:hypothetical protein [bacterium]